MQILNVLTEIDGQPAQLIWATCLYRTIYPVIVLDRGSTGAIIFLNLFNLLIYYVNLKTTKANQATWFRPSRYLWR